MRIIRQILTSKIGYGFVIAHWVWAGLAVYQRGGLSYPFHFTYEPVLFQALVLWDIIWVSLSETYLTSAINSLPGASFTRQEIGLGGGILLAAFQWLAVGCLVGSFWGKKVK